MVIGIDSLERDGDYHVYQYTGDPNRTQAAQRKTLDWVREVERRGAGEIVLNCMNQDGVRKGYDVVQLAAVRAATQVPLIASGGAGAMEHFKDVFEIAHVDGALAASVFHTAAIEIGELKRYLADAGIAVRPVQESDRERYELPRDVGDGDRKALERGARGQLHGAPRGTGHAKGRAEGRRGRRRARARGGARKTRAA